MSIQKIKLIAESAALKAGKMLKKEFQNFDRSTVHLKHQREVVTKFDLESERIIINEIKKSFPDHRILSEEAGENKKDSPCLWIIDPIDGTTNFTMHNPLFCVSIGVAVKKDNGYELICGVVHAPILGETYVAVKGKGATLNGKKIKVSKTKEGKVLNAFCHGRDTKYVKQAIKYFSAQKLGGFDCRQLGSAAIELAYVAAGRLESIVIPGTNPWDVAAGALLVREAGGRVSDFAGKEWTVNEKNIAASNRLVHHELLSILKKIK